LAFLLYTLVNFWNEGLRSPDAARMRRTALQHSGKPKVVVAKRPISPEIRGNVTVMPGGFQRRSLPRRQDRMPSNWTTAAFSLQGFRKNK